MFFLKLFDYFLSKRTYNSCFWLQSSRVNGNHKTYYLIQIYITKKEIVGASIARPIIKF